MSSISINGVKKINNVKNNNTYNYNSYAFNVFPQMKIYENKLSQ